jgi:hypothetical protein
LAGDVSVFVGGQADFDGGALFGQISVRERVFDWFRLEVTRVCDLNVRVGVMLRIA